MSKRTYFLANAAKLGGLTLLSSALGFARELLIARDYGASHLTDSYLVAVSVPMLLYALFFGSGLNVSLVPRLTLALHEDEARGRAIFAQFLSGGALVSAAAVVVIACLSRQLVELFAPGISGSPVAAAAVSRLSPLLFLFVVSYALGSFHCAHHRVSRWGLISVIQNLVLVLVLAAIGAHAGIAGLIAGTLGGAALAFLLQAVMAARDGFREPWSSPLRQGSGRDILLSMSAFALAAGLGGDYGTAQADIFLIRFFGSHLRAGSITLLALGNKLMGFPVVLIGAALGLALLPSLSLAITTQDAGKANQQFLHALSLGLLLICPVSVVYFDLASPVVSMVLSHTALSAAQLHELEQVVHAYAAAPAGMVLALILNSYLAALRRIRILILAGVLTVSADAGLMWMFSRSFGIEGIAWAVTIGSFIYCVILSVALAPALSRSTRVAVLLRSLLIVTGTLGMHAFVIATKKLSFPGSSSISGNVILPLACGTAAYLGWLALHRKRLQLSFSQTQ